MKQIEQIYIIKAPVAKVWNALTDSAVAELWGAGPAIVDATEGGKFSYWGGDIHGINTKIVPEKLLEQDWYEHEHPNRLHKVIFILSSSDSVTIIHLAQTDVGDDEFKSMVEGWADYYFDPIKKLLEQQV